MYHLGPGPKLMVATEISVTVTPIWNVCARFNGSELPDEYVLGGMHTHMRCGAVACFPSSWLLAIPPRVCQNVHALLIETSHR